MAKASKHEVELILESFAGGLNLLASPYKLGQDQAWQANNFLLSEYGTITKRLGITDAGAHGASGVRVLAWTYLKANDGGITIIAHLTDGTVRHAVYTGSIPLTWNTEFSGYSTTVPMRFAQFLKSGLAAIWMTNGVDDVSWIDSALASGTVATAPKGTAIAAWKDTLWISGTTANPQRVYSSATGDGTTWPALNFVDIGVGIGGAVLALMDTDPALVVFKDRSTSVIYDPIEFTNVVLDNSKGCISQASIVRFSGSSYYLSHAGVCKWLGDGPSEVISIAIDPVFKLDLYQKNNLTSPQKFMGYAYKDRVGWSLPFATPNAQTPQLEIYPEFPNAPSVWQTRSTAGGNVVPLLGINSEVIGDHLFGAAVDSNKIFRCEEAAEDQDDSVSFFALWSSGWLNFGDPDATKYLQYVKILAQWEQPFTAVLLFDGDANGPGESGSPTGGAVDEAVEYRLDCDRHFREIMVSIRHNTTGFTERVVNVAGGSRIVPQGGAVIHRVYLKARMEGSMRTTR